MTARKILLQRKYNLTNAPIPKREADPQGEAELGDRLWYGRKMPAAFYREKGTSEEVIKGMLKGKREAEKKYARRA